MARGMKKTKAWYSHPVLTVMFLVVIGFFVGRLAEHALQYRTAEEARDTQLARVQVLTDEFEALETRLDRIQTPEGFEREVKDRFRLTREGEEMVVIVREEDELVTPEPVPAEPEKTFWQKMLFWQK